MRHEKILKRGPGHTVTIIEIGGKDVFFGGFETTVFLRIEKDGKKEFKCTGLIPTVSPIELIKTAVEFREKYNRE